MKPLFYVLLILGLTAVACNLQTPTPAPTGASIPIPPPLPTVAAPQLTSFEMLDAQNGWAADETHLLRTADGGQTWYDATPPGVTNVGGNASMYFYDTALAWLILPSPDFSTGTQYTTSDGGSTWTITTVPFSGAILEFFDLQTGVAFTALGVAAGSEAVALYATSNGGTDWTRVYINDPTVPGSSNTLPLSGQKAALGFRHRADGYVGGNIPLTDDFYLFETQDGGMTWFERSLPWPADRTGYFAEVEQIVFFDQEEGYIVVTLVGDLSENYIYQTTDSGFTWTQLPGIIPRANFFTLLPGPMVFCWNPDGRIYYTLDGAAWDEVTPAVTFGDYLRDLQFVDAETGFALTLDWNTNASSFYVTHDTGATWTTLIP